MDAQYRCKNERRRQAVLDSTTLNGIDYLEVSGDQLSLQVFFLHNLPGQTDGVPNDGPPQPLTPVNIKISGGARVQDVRVVSAASADNVLTLGVNARGDFSTYTLSLVRSSTEPEPPHGFDAQLSEIEFSFKVDCASDFDCAPDDECPEPTLPAPQIDYLAKDYSSFRRLMFDRLAVIMPDWQERNPADLGVALVEVLALAADHLSYYQDAVATESYLGTARRRVSVRRHARLVDYFMHDGANSRAWVAFEVKPGSAADGFVLPGPLDGTPGAQLLTRLTNLTVGVDPRDLFPAISAGALVFETMHDLTLRAAHNEIHFYTWGDENCCLPKGATRAALYARSANGSISLRVGDVLVIEEVRGAETGVGEDADPTHRHAVRLTRVSDEITDPLFTEGEPPEPVRVVEIEWSVEDALPFPLCLDEVNDPTQPGSRLPVSVARANVVLADHGQSIDGEELEPLPDAGTGSVQPRRYYPALRSAPVTSQGRVREQQGDRRLVLFDPVASASAALRWELRDTYPAVELREPGNADLKWLPQRDLLNSDRFASEFVVELEDGGGARLRFGDGILGREPVDGLIANYRIGGGRAGNVGAGAISHLVVDPDRVGGTDAANEIKSGIQRIRNPLPAQGGADPEPLEQVRLYAPQAFRVQERAVTEADYAAVAERHPEVQKAAATRRWTGSWYTMFVTIDRKRGQPVDDTFKREMSNYIERFRLAGYDLEIESPRFVPLDFALEVCAAPGYFRSNVKLALLETFSNADLPDGRRGFFHPDNFTFGQPVYLSRVIAAAMQVPGVSWVDVIRFQRWGQNPANEIELGSIKMGRLEIARLDNDPNAAENGKLDFQMQGGL